jgi:hypothetical protein
MISDLRLKRAAPLSRRVTPFHRRWDWGRRLATSIISASHASVNDESEARRGRPGSGRPDDATANTLVLQDGRIRIRTLVRLIASRQYIFAFDQLSSVKIADTVGPVVHNDQVGAARSSSDRRRCFTELRTTSAGELTIRTLRTEWNGWATKDAEI